MIVMGNVMVAVSLFYSSLDLFLLGLFTMLIMPVLVEWWYTIYRLEKPEEIEGGD